MSDMLCDMLRAISVTAVDDADVFGVGVLLLLEFWCSR